MADWEIWVTILALWVATALTRSTFWMIGHHITIPKRMQEVLRFAPACALAAIIAPDMLMMGNNELAVSLHNPRLLAGVAATLYYLSRKSMIETIIFGMLAFTVLRIWLQ